jgi:hypothetical protein
VADGIFDADHGRMVGNRQLHSKGKAWKQPKGSQRQPGVRGGRAVFA